MGMLAYRRQTAKSNAPEKTSSGASPVHYFRPSFLSPSANQTCDSATSHTLVDVGEDEPRARLVVCELLVLGEALVLLEHVGEEDADPEEEGDAQAHVAAAQQRERRVDQHLPCGNWQMARATASQSLMHRMED